MSQKNSRSPSLAPLSSHAAPEEQSSTRIRVRARPRRDALTRVRHDLRSTVHALLGYTDLIGSGGFGPLAPEQTRFLGHVRSAAQQLQELVDAYTELCRPPADAGALEPTALPLEALLPHLGSRLRARSLPVDWAASLHCTGRLLSLDVRLLERALLEVARVVTRGGARPAILSATEDGERARLALHPQHTSPRELTTVDALENELSNADFVRLRLAEVLLARQGFSLRVDADRDYAELSIV